MSIDSKDTEARLTIIEYRQDQTETGLTSLRTEYQSEHAALRKSLQGIEKNLQTIKWVSIGAGAAFLSQIPGLSTLIASFKMFL